MFNYKINRKKIGVLFISLFVLSLISILAALFFPGAKSIFGF